MDLALLYLKANKNLVAKSIGELTYEENIKPTKINQTRSYNLVLASGASYHFEAVESIWTSLQVDANSITRTSCNDEKEVTSAAQFFIDAKTELKLTDIVLANFLEELNNTLSRDVFILNKRKDITSKDLLEMSEVERESYLDGHPKALLNKGRIGWNSKENEIYSPEQSEGFQLIWLAVKKIHSTYILSKTISEEEILNDSLDEKERKKLSSSLKDKNIETDQYLIIPVHPWQWENIIKTQFLYEINSKDVVYLGAYGDLFRPQVSLRTLSNISRPSKLDIKLPLTILNTSAIRGLPKKYIKIGVTISDYLEELINKDTLLKDSEVLIIKERAGVSYQSNFFSQITEAPYRYHEYLGVTWRDNLSVINDKDRGISSLITANLLFVDDSGKSFISELIRESGVSTPEWLTLYFQKVVIPLYHLQSAYGISLVSHGQNIILRTKNSLPFGVALKDFGGDLRITEEHKEKYANIEGIENIANLPATHLIHDLYTGHMVTLLRFVSAILRDTEEFAEIDFYSLLAKEIKQYNTNYPPNRSIDLLREKFERVIINTVRFQIGYGDSSERPVPKLGSDLDNPIFLGLKSKKEG